MSGAFAAKGALRLRGVADALAVAAAISVPWSTSATSICVPLWVLACLPTLKLSALRDELARPAGGLPALLAVCGVLGTLWAGVSWSERIGGADSFVRLLVLPLLLAYFRDSRGGRAVLAGFLVSCTVLLACSGALVAWPRLGASWANDAAGGIPIKDYIAQSGEFVLCAFALAPFALACARARRWWLAAGLGLLAAAFLANVLYVATGRTSLVIMAVLLVVFCCHEFSWRGALAALAAAAIVAGSVWWSSPYLRLRVVSVYWEISTYEAANARTSAGERLEYWKKSIGFIAQAPIIGHGTGSITDVFRRSTAGQSGPADEVSANPHNQTFAVALQLGFLGTVLLYAMWMAHVVLFRGPRLVAWIGLVVVVENIVGSVFNSYLFDFTESWIYIFGVGIAGALARARSGDAAADGPRAGARAQPVGTV